MRKLLYITALISLSLACGVSAQLPEVVTQEAAPTAGNPTPESSVQMVVTAETLNIRRGAGTQYPALKKGLVMGDVVTCTEMRVIAESIWCKHVKGWSNAAFMKGQ